MKPADILKRLIWLSRELGREDRHLAILGEGNVSADLGDGTFYVKASGSQLATIDAAGFTRVKVSPILEALDSTPTKPTTKSAGFWKPAVWIKKPNCPRWKHFCTPFA